MKDKAKKIFAGACLGLIGMGCLTGCNAEDLKIPTDYNVTTPSDYNITTTITGEKQYRLTVINDSEHGTIYPDLNNETSSVLVEEGDSYTFTIRAKEGYKLDNLLIDGELCEPQEIYTFDDINSDHVIGAVYSKKIKSLTVVGINFDAYFSNESDYISGSNYKEVELLISQNKNIYKDFEYDYKTQGVGYFYENTNVDCVSFVDTIRVGKNAESAITNFLYLTNNKNGAAYTKLSEVLICGNEVALEVWRNPKSLADQNGDFWFKLSELEYIGNDYYPNLYKITKNNYFKNDFRIYSKDVTPIYLTNIEFIVIANY